MTNDMASLNLCDIFGRLKQSTSNALTALLDRVPYKVIDRLYLGSYYCCNYFLQSQTEILEEILDFAKKSNRKVTLVVPPVFEKDFDRVCTKALRLIECYAQVIDELTINDFGALEFFSKNVNVKINYGRTMAKDSRDIRYEDFFQSTSTPRVFEPFYEKLLSSYQVGCVELDCTHATIKIPEHKESLSVAVHIPYCYASIGSICEFAAVHRDGYNKFLYAGSCRCECNNMMIQCTYEENYNYLRLGRSVQYENSSCIIDATQPYRVIYTPVNELIVGGVL